MTDVAQKMLLFVSASAEARQNAATIFQTEATKADLAWNGNSADLSDTKSIASAQMIIVLTDASGKEQIQTTQAPAETWKLPDLDGASDQLQKNVSQLIVRLIFQGGRRTPAQTTEQVKSITPSESAKLAAQAMVRVGLESKSRGGKKVSVITGLPLSDTEFDALTTKLKRTCGTGGTHKDGQIEIQGDHRDKLMAELQKLGYKPKRTGG